MKPGYRMSSTRYALYVNEHRMYISYDRSGSTLQNMQQDAEYERSTGKRTRIQIEEWNEEAERWEPKITDWTGETA